MLFPTRRRLAPSVVVEVRRYSCPDTEIAASLMSSKGCNGRPSANHCLSVLDALSCNQLGWSCARSTNDAVPVAPENAGPSETYLLGGSPIAPLPPRTAYQVPPPDWQLPSYEGTPPMVTSVRGTG